MLRIICIITFLSIGVSANAVCNSRSCADVYIDRLYVNSSGLIYIGTSGDEGTLTCPAVSGVYLTLQVTEPGAKAIYSTLLGAQMADKKVNIRTEEISSNCKVQYVTLDRQ